MDTLPSHELSMTVLATPGAASPDLSGFSGTIRDKKRSPKALTTVGLSGSPERRGTFRTVVVVERHCEPLSYGTSTDTIDKLCKYFGCQVGDVAQFVDEPGALPATKTATSASRGKGAEARIASTKAPAKRKKA